MRTKLSVLAIAALAILLWAMPAKVSAQPESHLHIFNHTRHHLDIRGWHHGENGRQWIDVGRLDPGKEATYHHLKRGDWHLEAKNREGRVWEAEVHLDPAAPVNYTFQ